MSILEQYDRTAYSKATGFKKFSYNCILHMMENNDEIWKLLYYNQSDAWNRPSLSLAEKRSLIYAGEPDETLFRVFSSDKQPNAWINEACILRIFPYQIVPENRTVNTTTMCFDIYTHYRINTLSNYYTRNDTLVEEIIALFNGANIGGLGRLFLDAGASRADSSREIGQSPFGGKRVAMSTKQN